MEYVDGEGTPAARAAIEAHLAGCGACQALAAEQQRLAGSLRDWRVPPAPDSLQPPQARAARVWWRPSRGIAAGFAAAAVVLVAVAVNQRPRPLSAPAAQAISLLRQEAPLPPAGPGARTPNVSGNVQGQSGARGGRRAELHDVGPLPETASQPALHAPSVIRTATLQIVATDFAGVRESVESIVTGAAGFLDHLTVAGDGTRARVLRGSLRVPGDQLNGVLAKLRPLGQVLEDTQGAQDVADQLVDLDARLASARATERRLIDLLQNRTGRLSDVLEVEREITRVRLDIERLDAEKANMTRRVAYATIDLTISEDRKETIAGPLSLTTRLKVAALDGIESALDSMAGVVLFALRAGPTLAFWGCTAAIVWFGVRRIRDKRLRISD